MLRTAEVTHERADEVERLRFVSKPSSARSCASFVVRIFRIPVFLLSQIFVYLQIESFSDRLQSATRIKDRRNILSALNARSKVRKQIPIYQIYFYLKCIDM